MLHWLSTALCRLEKKEAFKTVKKGKEGKKKKRKLCARFRPVGTSSIGTNRDSCRTKQKEKRKNFYVFFSYQLFLSRADSSR